MSPWVQNILSLICSSPQSPKVKRGSSGLEKPSPLWHQWFGKITCLHPQAGIPNKAREQIA